MKTKISLFTACMLLLLFACEEPQFETANRIPVNNGILMFADEDAYIQALDQLDKEDLNQSGKWTSIYNIHSLRKSILNGEDLKDEYSNLPASHQILLNKNGMVQIGNNIVWYTDGTKYYIPAAKFQNIKNLEDAKQLAELKRNYHFTPVGRTNDNARTSLEVDFGKTSIQKEFYYKGDTGSRRKWVDELYSLYETFSGYRNTCNNGYNYDTRITLYLLLKLEWYGNSSHTWKPAGETRDISGTINYTVNMSGIAAPCMPVFTTADASSSRTVNVTVTSQLYVNLAQYRGILDYSVTTYGGRWNVAMSGSMYHFITNDITSNKWTNTYTIWN
jgi:hypothetical protein